MVRQSSDFARQIKRSDDNKSAREKANRSGKQGSPASAPSGYRFKKKTPARKNRAGASKPFSVRSVAVRLKVGDHISTVAWLLQTGERHLRSLYERFWLRKECIERCCVPDDTGSAKS